MDIFIASAFPDLLSFEADLLSHRPGPPLMHWFRLDARARVPCLLLWPDWDASYEDTDEFKSEIFDVFCHRIYWR